MGDRYSPDESNITINTQMDRQNTTFNISVALHSLQNLTAKQADTYLKGLIAQALKTAVMENYASIQRLVDEFIHSDEARAMLENAIKEEIGKRVEQSIKDMFG